jgi:hypothetical protein
MSSDLTSVPVHSAKSSKVLDGQADRYYWATTDLSFLSAQNQVTKKSIFNGAVQLVNSKKPTVSQASFHLPLKDTATLPAPALTSSAVGNIPSRAVWSVSGLSASQSIAEGTVLPGPTENISAPIIFEQNVGQFHNDVLFAARTPSFMAFVTATEVVYVLNGIESGKYQSEDNHETQQDVVRFELAGVSSNVSGHGVGKLACSANYFLGDKPDKWHANVPTYEAVRLQGVYPGIDVVYYANANNEFEYDFIVAPGADPSRIQLDVVASGGIGLDEVGNLTISTQRGSLMQRAPILYQSDADSQEIVDGKYKVDGSLVAFEIGDYDKTRPLVIDPVVAYSSYLGGSDIDSANGIRVDASGIAYVVGSTASTNFPTKDQGFQFAGGTDVFISKFNTSLTGQNSLVYSSFIGGGSYDEGAAIAVDSSGNMYVSGSTNSTNFPTVNAYQSALVPTDAILNAFLLKLNSSGNSILYSTYYGTTDFFGDTLEYQIGSAIAVDSNGKAYLGGYTMIELEACPIGGLCDEENVWDGFLAKFNPASSGASSLEFSKWDFGGKGHPTFGGGWHDKVLGLAVDSSSNLYVTGETDSTDFPIPSSVKANAFQSDLALYRPGGGLAPMATIDAYIARFNCAGVGCSSEADAFTYLGGSRAMGEIATPDAGMAVITQTVGADTFAYITGYTRSTNFPTKNAYQSMKNGGSDAFVSKFNMSLIEDDQLLYSTFVGGNGDDFGTAIAVSVPGVANVAGETGSSDFPTANPIFGDELDTDAFALKLSADAVPSLTFSTYFGKSGKDKATGIAVNSSGDILICGNTVSSDLPVQGAYQSTYGGSLSDGFVVRIA